MSIWDTANGTVNSVVFLPWNSTVAAQSWFKVPWLVVGRTNFITEGAVTIFIGILGTFALPPVLLAIATSFTYKYDAKLVPSRVSPSSSHHTATDNRAEKGESSLDAGRQDSKEVYMRKLAHVEVANYGLQGGVLNGIATIIKHIKSGRMQWSTVPRGFLFCSLAAVFVGVVAVVSKISVHSVTMNQTTITYETSKIANLSAILSGDFLQLAEGDGSGYFPFDAQLADSIFLSHTTVFDGLFTYNGYLCMGTYFPDSEFEATCLRDATTCTDTPYCTNMMNNVYFLELNETYPWPHRSGIVQGLSLETKGTFANCLSANCTYPIFIGFAGSLPVGSEFSTENVVPSASDRQVCQNAVDGYPPEWVHRTGLTKSKTYIGRQIVYGAGICKQQVEQCKVLIQPNGKIAVSDENCSPANPVVQNSDREIHGVGSFGNSPDMARLAMTTQYHLRNVDSTSLLSYAIGSLNFAFYTSLIRREDLQQNLTSLQVPVTQVTSRNGIAIDLISTTLLIVIFIAAMVITVKTLLLHLKPEDRVSHYEKLSLYSPLVFCAREVSVHKKLGFDKGQWDEPKLHSADDAAAPDNVKDVDDKDTKLVSEKMKSSDTFM
jgi:hypothetical protein